MYNVREKMCVCVFSMSFGGSETNDEKFNYD